MMVDCIECKNFRECQSRGELTGRLTSCLGFQQKPKTNADRIRAMSESELVEFIGHNSLCDRVQGECGNWCHDHNCPGCLEEWLRRPAEVTE